MTSQPAAQDIDWRALAVGLVGLIERTEPAYTPLLEAMPADLFALYKPVAAQLRPLPAPASTAAVQVEAPKPAATGLVRRPAPVRPTPAPITEPAPSDEDDRLPNGLYPSDETEDDLGPQYRDPSYIQPEPPVFDDDGTTELIAASLILDDGWTNPHGLGTSQAPNPDAPPQPSVIVPLVRRPAPLKVETAREPVAVVEDEGALPDWAGGGGVSDDIKQLEAKRAAAKGLHR